MDSTKPLKELVIDQEKTGYRYSIEPFLLADFVRLSTDCRVLDVGTGCGVIPLLLATRGTIEEVVAIEIQSALYDLAVKNISRNGASNRISVSSANDLNPEREILASRML